MNRNPYAYPASESITDLLELAMDPYKLERERLALALMLSFDWSCALDIGCGVGRQFKIFAEAAQRNHSRTRVLYAVEPDPNRRASAEVEKERLRTQGYSLEIKIHSDFRELSGSKIFDVLTCCQVLGHLTIDATKDLMSELMSVRQSGAPVILLVPIVTCEGTRDLIPWNSLETDEYYFAADLARTPYEDGYATALHVDQFNDMAQYGREGFLPVRSFNVGNISAKSNALCPFPVMRWSEALVDHSKVSEVFGFIYSFHRFSRRNGLVTQGDAILRLS